ncbi:hypothetical protein P5E87_15795, partial [Clostridium perfringens]|nr:hypothetical protein [Clostridium perfringens]
MALDTVPAGLESCDRGEGSLKVAFALSNCFTFNEMKAIIQQVNTAIATAASNKFYFNDAFIERKFAWGYY